MGLFDLFRKPDIQAGLETYRNTPGGILIDVRTPGEYRGGHIPDSINLPLQSINDASKVILKKDTPVFVYCQSGARSSQAVSALREIGYSEIENLGGISGYRGEVEK